jgi:hypothetical protein
VLFENAKNSEPEFYYCSVYSTADTSEFPLEKITSSVNVFKEIVVYDETSVPDNVARTPTNVLLVTIPERVATVPVGFTVSPAEGSRVQLTVTFEPA